MGRAARSRAQIKIRQPLGEMVVALPQADSSDDLKSSSHLIAEELNVKQVSLWDSNSELTELVAKPDFGKLGPKWGGKAKQVAETIKTLSQNQLRKLKEKGRLKVDMDGVEVELELEDAQISETEKPGWVVEAANEYKVALFTVLTEDLKNEGFARELVNKIQNMRKSAGFEVMDRIHAHIKTTDRLNQAINAFQDYVKKETLAQKLSLTQAGGERTEEWDINGEKAVISIERVRV